MKPNLVPRKDSKRFHHLYNAGKYSTAFIKVAMAAIHAAVNSKTSLVFYMLGHFVSSIYTLYWDLINDWGLLRTKSDNFLVSLFSAVQSRYIRTKV